MNAATIGRSPGSNVWHDLVRGATPARTWCGRDARPMFKFTPSDLRSGDRSHKACSNCRKARPLAE